MPDPSRIDMQSDSGQKKGEMGMGGERQRGLIF